MSKNRLEQILLFLKNHNIATVEQLVKVTEASSATIRRDLIKLDEEGVVIRTHGGVSLNQFIPFQPTTNEKQFKQIVEKERIAEYAVSLISPGNSILLDAGTTTLCIAKKIAHMPLRVITTDLHIALLLSEYKQIELIITGGRVDNSSQSCIGNHSLTLLENINPDIAFVSCNSWSLEKGVTAPTEEKANLKRMLQQNAKQKVLVADSSKYGKYSLFRATQLDNFTQIITDKGLPIEYSQALSSNDFKLSLV
ncbi:DeoR/GlpR family DNA-binding transcription regulator [Mannheimia haemolytica]|uniref:DeoR/GlpR family DNA-binding transcription regulator n=1 Tax=Mannheimia haemolytica TaxID=75985 RepID=UPI000588A6AE|nr:DeoR/GlpR family DNA-binding transcription regulator [Mannheimia haemolytica]AJE09133.1 DeoR/GlpR transcriptional regulator [Mannheimia haemolytica USDA-ARS-USMARC-184]UQX62683.1 DeoR/GlpR family DNA-binding transcription regulator [Mannheimia haemolytica]